MSKSNGPTLFDAFEEPPKQPSAAVPFDVALLALGTIRGLGEKGIRTLVGRFGDDLGAVFSAPYEETKELLQARKVTNANKVALTVAYSAIDLIQDGERECAELNARQVKILSPSNLPKQFSLLGNDAPMWLFVQGEPSLLFNRPSIAVVGTRNPSDLGYRATSIISHVLSPYNVVVVSGLADGIDGEAHVTSMNKGLKNVAFLGHGINKVFPEETRNIRSDIIKQGGAVLSEYMPSQSYQKHQFVERNRLQAALADIVIPVEAASQSGTAHTVRFARKLGKPLVGISWVGATGLVDDLRNEGNPIIDIFTPSGQRELDQLVQSLMHRYEKPAYPFGALERQLAREMQTRAFTDDDIAILIESIEQVSRELRDNG